MTMRSRSRVRVSVAAAWIVAAATSASLGVACRDIVTDDVVDAEAELCGRLDACGLAGCDEVRDFFLTDDPDGNDLLLGLFEGQRCADGCGDAPICLDVPGLCTPPGDTCTTDILCCGASQGEARCQPVRSSSGDGGGGEPADGLCCRGLGVPCTEDLECCQLDSGEPLTCRRPPGDALNIKTCGGAPACTLLGLACEEDAECCSRSCEGGKCDRVRCVESGGGCVVGEDTCCSASDQCLEGRCQPPPECPGDPGCPCGERGGTCTPDEEGTCCDGLLCVTTQDGGAACASTDCLPVGADCATDEDCNCQGTKPENVCLDVTAAGVGAPKSCQILPCESEEGGACGDDRPCCASSGLACDAAPGESGVCAPRCEPTACHSAFSYGPPIPPLDETDPSGAACPESAACAAAICAEDPYCCCFLWDEICIEQAQTDADAGGACASAP